MGGLFGKAPPPPPAPEAPPPPPDTATAQARSERESADMMAKRRGRASTVLSTGLMATEDEPKTATRKLLGS
jgi:hypothetical protein